MTASRPRPSPLLKWLFRFPVWLFKLRLGSLLGGRVFVIVHHGRKSGKRYRSGLEVLTRRDGELFVFSAWGTRAHWFRNIEAGGVDGLWDGRRRYGGAGFRLVEPDEAVEILGSYELEHPSTAKRTLPRMLPGYDGSEAMRRQMAEAATIVAFRPRD
jgi:deazaflavin-dependent oxidoreductase (nitroreductase family)